MPLEDAEQGLGVPGLAHFQLSTDGHLVAGSGNITRPLLHALHAGEGSIHL